MNKILIGFLMCLAMAVWVPGAHADLITNGSFENHGPFTPSQQNQLNQVGFVTFYQGSTTITGWEETADSIDYKNWYWAAYDGQWSLDLNGNTTGGIKTVLNTDPGVTYTVEFEMSGNFAGGPDTKHLSVSATGNPAQTFTFDKFSDWTPSNMGWTAKSYTFTAVGEQTTLEFDSLDSGYFGPALDAVRDDVVPVPPSLLLLGSGLVALGVWRSRAKKI